MERKKKRMRQGKATEKRREEKVGIVIGKGRRREERENRRG